MLKRVQHKIRHRVQGRTFNLKPKKSFILWISSGAEKLRASMPLSIRLTSPQSTLPGPISSVMETPSLLTLLITSTHLTGLVSWRIKSPFIFAGSLHGSASTLVTRSEEHTSELQSRLHLV